MYHGVGSYIQSWEGQRWVVLYYLLTKFTQPMTVCPGIPVVRKVDSQSLVLAQPSVGTMCVCIAIENFRTVQSIHGSGSRVHQWKLMTNHGMITMLLATNCFWQVALCRYARSNIFVSIIKSGSFWTTFYGLLRSNPSITRHEIPVLILHSR